MATFCVSGLEEIKTEGWAARPTLSPYFPPGINLS